MKKLICLLAAITLIFAACSNNKKGDSAENGIINDGDGIIDENRDDSMKDDSMAEDSKDVIDDVKDGVNDMTDGAADATKDVIDGTENAVDKMTDNK